MDSPKKVDESWKDAVLKEKATLAGPAPKAASQDSPSSGAPAEEEGGESEFLGFISTLAVQAMMALGEVPHPQTRERHEDLAQAKYLIDVIRVLSEKTQGNLTAHEASEIKNLLYQLQMKFVRKEQA